jgi:DNA-binding transcriptional ArsR family regulator
MSVDKIFDALSSAPRRRVLAYLSMTDMTAGEIAERFAGMMSQPTQRAEDLGSTILAFLSNTVKCRVRQVSRHSHGAEKRACYDYVLGITEKRVDDGRETLMPFGGELNGFAGGVKSFVAE